MRITVGYGDPARGQVRKLLRAVRNFNLRTRPIMIIVDLLTAWLQIDRFPMEKEEMTDV